MSGAARRSPATARVRAPELAGGTWLNTATPLSLADLRGRFVLLDFWTSGCANCWHVLDELRPFEHEYADVLTVVGVHSPKFPFEARDSTVAATVARLGITHPVRNDPDLALWRQYAVRAWPTLVLVDPEGYVIAQAAGEGQAGGLAMVLADRLPTYESRGTVRHGIPAWHPEPPVDTALRFPSAAIVLPAARTGRDTDTLLVADTGHHCLTEVGPDDQVLRRVGEGSLDEPTGLTLLPPGVAPYDVLVADTAAHVLRGVRLADGALIATVDLPALLSGASTITGPVPGVLSPWDVAWWPAPGRVVVAAAGVHLLLALDLGPDGTGEHADVLAGTTVEGLRDGPARDGWLAQPSRLAVDGDRLWFVDAETSALRWLSAEGRLHTAVGEGLFDFGHVDGPTDVARLQHPLGLVLDADGTVLVADTYNGAVRRWDGERLTTVARDLAEPTGLVRTAAGVVVVESAGHRLTPLSAMRDATAASGAHATGGTTSPTAEPPTPGRPVTVLAPGRVTLRIAFTPPPGRHVDRSTGPGSWLTVAPAELVLTGAGESVELTRTLELTTGAGVLSVTAQVATCDDGGDSPACYLSRQDWGVPVRVEPGGAETLELVLFA